MTVVTHADPDLESLRAELDPVRNALLEDARAEAERLLLEATRDAALIAEEADRSAAAEIERAEQRGAMSAQARTDQSLARTRSDGHNEILRAKDDIGRRLHQAVRAAALDLRSDTRYPALLEELEQLARSQLGPDVQIDHDPGGLGGIVACAGSRRVDYTLPALADRALDALADRVAQLWA